VTQIHSDQTAVKVSADLGYFTIPVADLERGKAFYAAVFGWQFEAGESYAHVPNTTPPGGLHVDDAAHPKVWFRVPDIHAAVARVRERGGEATEPEVSDSGLSADCRDDQGTHFSLWQPAPGL
jgi:predicted enzyme related to lactoylglutathione lyase